MLWGARLSFSVSLVLFPPLTFFNRSAPSTTVSSQHALKFRTQPTAAVDPAALLNPHARVVRPPLGCNLRSSKLIVACAIMNNLVEM